uniref:NADH-ubiquinone oxidoreductase chain 2 n=1 Tax=Cleptes metallicorpus TaxID=2491147 RepID=A0A3S8V0F4_9HYME|nr:NADH dehydrogenase subunit 2 [Cleptes metallicorpus]
MYNFTSKMLILPLMILLNILFLSSSSYFMMWMFMEMNTFMFITLMAMNNSYYWNTIINYFIIQTMSGLMLMMSILWMFYLYNYDMKWTMILNLTILLKLGMFPFNFWYPMTMKNMIWNNIFILATFQKIMPFTFLHNFPDLLILNISIYVSSLKSTLMSINSTNLKVMFAYSSINHMCWLMMLLLINMNMWIFYFSFYSLMSFSLCMTFKTYNLLFIKCLTNFKFSIKMKNMIMFMIMSISGLPPFTGFILKWLSILNLSYSFLWMTLYWLIMMSLIAMFLYLRIYMTFMFLSSHLNKNMNYINNNNNWMWMFISLMLILFISITMLI